MICVPTPRARALPERLALVLLLVPAEALAQSDAGPPMTAVIASAETVRAGVAHTGGLIADRLTLGLAGAYESHDFEAQPAPAAVHGRGITAAPYALFKLDRVLSVDASGGYGRLGYDGAGGGGRADAERWFGAANLNANYAADPWRLGGSLGALHAGARLDAVDGSVRYDGQTSTVGRVRLGYVFRVLDGLEPYVSAEGRYAALDDGADARLDSVLGIGAALRLGGASLLLQGTTVDGDDAARAYAGTLTFRLGL